MVNLEPNSASVGLGDLSQPFDDLLGGTNTDRRNNNGDSERINAVQTRLPGIIGEDNTDNNGDRSINDISSNRSVVFAGRGDGDNLIGNLHLEHVNSRSSNAITGLDVTGEPSISRHQQHVLQDHIHSISRTNSGLEIRVHRSYLLCNKMK